MRNEDALKKMLEYFKEYRTDIWLTMKKYDETPNLLEEFHKAEGKIELLEEILETDCANKGDAF